VETIVAVAQGAKSGSTVSALVNGVITTVQVARDLTVATGDPLMVTKFGGLWVAVGRLYASAPTAPDNPNPSNPNQPSTSGSLVVSPVETRSYRNGAWRTDNGQVYQGNYGGGGNHQGCAFYGSAPRSLTGATVTSAIVKIRRQAGGWYAAQASTMRLVTQSTRPAGAPTLTSSTAGPSLAVDQSTNTFAVPASWAQAMVDGTAGGIGFYEADGDPYIVFSGTGSWSPAFTLTIYWTR
jgi:hypothetical protein